MNPKGYALAAIVTHLPVKLRLLPTVIIQSDEAEGEDVNYDRIPLDGIAIIIANNDKPDSIATIGFRDFFCGLRNIENLT